MKYKILNTKDLKRIIKILGENTKWEDLTEDEKRIINQAYNEEYLSDKVFIQVNKFRGDVSYLFNTSLQSPFTQKGIELLSKTSYARLRETSWIAIIIDFSGILIAVIGFIITCSNG